MTSTARSKQPSEAFQAALKDLKLIWEGGVIHTHTPRRKEQTRIKLQKHKELIELGKKESLSAKFISHELTKLESNCLLCNKRFIESERYHAFLCPECDDKARRQEYKETQEEKKKEQLPIERYCGAILDLRPTYDFSYEEALKLWKEGQKENEDRTNATIQQRIERVRDRVKPEGITNKEWQREKQGNKLRAKEQGVRTDVQRDRDDKFKEENSPNWVMRDTLDKITCMCEVDELRAGECCKTCKVLRKVHEYMLNMFKDAAEGRSTII
jgi:hypothetical protein